MKKFGDLEKIGNVNIVPDELESYFDEVEVGDKVFGLVFGLGQVVSVFGRDSYYTFEVEYKVRDSNYTIAYTADGIPAWNVKLNDQTVYYVDDIDLMVYDITPIENELSIKQIIKLRNKNQLEVKCPSGVWRNINKCPQFITQQYLEDAKFYLFRKGI